MPIKADLEGNLTKDPEGRTVKVDGEPRKIVEIRVFSDVNRLVGDRYEQDADKSGGVDVTIWREGLGDAVLAHFRKGARVWVTGDLHLHRYKDRESGEPRAALRMTADNVALLPYRIDRIAFAPRRGAAEDADQVDQAQSQTDAGGGEP